MREAGSIGVIVYPNFFLLTSGRKTMFFMYMQRKRVFDWLIISVFLCLGD